MMPTLKNQRVQTILALLTSALAACGNQKPNQRSEVRASVETSGDVESSEGPEMTVEDVVQSFKMGSNLPVQDVSAEDRAQWEASLVPENQIRPAGAEIGDADFQLALGDVAADQREVVDLRANDTGIRNQGSEGTCTAFATVATMENLVARFYAEKVDLSERHHWTTYANYQSTTSLQKASQIAIVPESVWPYKGSKPSSTTGLGIAKINSYVTTKLSLQPIVDSLRKGNPVVIAVGVLSSLMSPRQGGIIQGGSAQSGAGHALAVTGAIIDSSVPGGGYFVIKNSWGPNWGDKGYGYVAFDYCQRTWCSAYSVQDASMLKDGVVVNKPSNPVTPSPSPSVVPSPTPSQDPVTPSPSVVPANQISEKDFKLQPYASRRGFFGARYFYLAVVAEQSVLQKIKSIRYDDSSSKYLVINGAAEDVRVSVKNLASPAFKTRSRDIHTDDIIITLRDGKTITLPGIDFSI
jgi:C1A family cysteine protease